MIDIDGTLANIDHRKCFIEQRPKNFKDFLDPLNISKDKVNLWCSAIIEKFYGDYKIVLCSGRTEDCRGETEKWLWVNGIVYDHLFMRASLDYRKDFEVKKEIFENKIRDVFQVLFVVDDRQQVVDMWRKLGLVCLQCDYGDF